MLVFYLLRFWRGNFAPTHLFSLQRHFPNSLRNHSQHNMTIIFHAVIVNIPRTIASNYLAGKLFENHCTSHEDDKILHQDHLSVLHIFSLAF